MLCQFLVNSEKTKILTSPGGTIIKPYKFEPDFVGFDTGYGNCNFDRHFSVTKNLSGDFKFKVVK